MDIELPTIRYTLPNGLQAILLNRESATISAKLVTWAGGINDPRPGTAHFLEHMMINAGTQSYTKDQVAKIKQKFGYINAYTSNASISFVANILPDRLELLLDYLASATFPHHFDSKTFEQQRQRILREIADKWGQSDHLDNRTFREALYGKNSPLVYDNLGCKDDIMEISTADLEQYHQQFFGATNMQLYLVGKLPNKCKQLVEKKFLHFNSGKTYKPDEKLYAKPVRTKPTMIHTYAKDLVNLQDKENSNAKIVIGIDGPGQSDEDYHACKLLSDILTRGRDSRIFQRISKEMGLAYRISGSYGTNKYQNLISVNGKVSAKDFQAAIEAIFSEFTKLQTDQVSSQTLERVIDTRKYLAARWLDNNEDTLSIVELEDFFSLDYATELKKMMAITPQHIQNAARKYLPTSRDEGNYVLMLRDPLKD